MKSDFGNSYGGYCICATWISARHRQRRCVVGSISRHASRQGHTKRRYCFRANSGCKPHDLRRGSRGEPVARCPTEAIARRPTSTSRGSTCASSGPYSRTPRAARRLSRRQSTSRTCTAHAAKSAAELRDALGRGATEVIRRSARVRPWTQADLRAVIVYSRKSIHDRACRQGECARDVPARRGRGAIPLRRAGPSNSKRP